MFASSIISRRLAEEEQFAPDIPASICPKAMSSIESGKLKSSDGPTQRKPTKRKAIAIRILTRLSTHFGTAVDKAAKLAKQRGNKQKKSPT